MKCIESIKVMGMSCVVCSKTIEKVLLNTAGVVSCDVNFASGNVNIEFDNDIVTLKDLEKIIIKTGYGVQQNKQEIDLLKKETYYLEYKKNMILSWIFSTPLMIIMFINMLDMSIIPHNIKILYPWIAIAFSLYIFIFPGRQTLKGAIKSTQNASPSMDVLIAMGCISAFITGCLPNLFGHHSFIEIGAMIMAIHLTGRYIEARTKGKTSEAIRKLMEIGAKSAFIQKEENIIEIPISNLQLGDIMIVKPGAKIPTDGIIVDGESYIDESMATGESMPVRKKVDQFVFGATINGNGSLKVRVTKIGKDTFLSQMIKLVERAQNSKVPVQAFADKVTGGFVPIVLLIALAAFFIHLFYPVLQHNIITAIPFKIPWLISNMSPLAQALFTSISILVIACPCALGLATPTAIMAGIGLGTKHGILIKNGESVQVLPKAKSIIFDKTGTLTDGKPIVTDLNIYAEDREEVLHAIFSLEILSDHPLAQSIIKHLDSYSFTSLEVKDYENISGKGIAGTIFRDTTKIRETWIVGSMKFMQENFVDIREKEDFIYSLQLKAKTIVLAAKDMKLQAIIAISDTIKKDAFSTIKMLHKMRLKTIMLTGDNLVTAKEVAAKLGIMEVQAEVMPEEKLKFVEKYQNITKKPQKSNEIEKKETVIMVGDGINDAPALKQADVSIAIGGGTDIAIESADIVLVRNEVLPIVKSLLLSKATFSIVKQNLFWAFFYNIIAIPMAFCGLLHPVIAEIAMALSSITVVSNANRLRNKSLKLPTVYIKKDIIKIEGMSCEHCVAKVQESLSKIVGVSEIKISLEKKEAELIVSEGFSRDNAIKIIEDLGFIVIENNKNNKSI